VGIAHSKNPAANSREGNYAAMMLVPAGGEIGVRHRF
jgi:hypothetical protein